MSSRLLRAASLAVALAVVWGAIQTASGLWVLSEVRKRAKIGIEGKYSPDLFRPSFRLKDAKVVYEDKIEARAVTLKVRYNLVPLSPELLHVWIEGMPEMKIRLLGKWAEVREVEDEAPLERFKVELQLVRKGILLHAADIQSPVFQFQLKKSANFKGQPLG